MDIFRQKLTGLPNVSWTKPKGGYFISLNVPKGFARRVVALAKEAGIELTPAGATHPYGNDPDDSGRGNGHRSSRSTTSLCTWGYRRA